MIFEASIGSLPQMHQMSLPTLCPSSTATAKQATEFLRPHKALLSMVSHLPIPADEAHTVSRIDTGVRECADLRLDDHGSYLTRAREPAVSLPTGLAAPPIETIPTEIKKARIHRRYVGTPEERITLSGLA